MDDILFEIEDLGDNDVNIKRYIGPDEGEIIIPEKINGKNVVRIGWLAFVDNNKITKITIPNSVICIQRNAFGCCSGLTSLYIPASVRIIKDYAFKWCVNLESIKVDSKNKVYDSREKCNAIIETATNTLMFGCKNTIIPDSVKDISEYAFHRCIDLRKIEIGKGISNIRENVFGGCIGLREVTIHPSLQSIELDAFSECCSIDKVFYTGDIKQWCSIKNVGDLMYNGSENLELSINGEEIKDKLIIPGDVEKIGYSTFANCSKITSLKIEQGVQVVGHTSFASCRELREVILPDSVRMIGYGAFMRCEKLKTVILGNGITKIGSLAFYQCSSLEEITIPESVIEIDSHAFNDCPNLRVVEIKDGANLKSLNPDLFAEKPNLRKIKIDKNCPIKIVKFILNYAIVKNIDEMIEDEYLERITKKMLKQYIDLAREKERISILQRLIVMYNKRFGNSDIRL